MIGIYKMIFNSSFNDSSNNSSNNDIPVPGIVLDIIQSYM